MKRIVVGITGASGVIYGVRFLEVLHGLDVKTHLVLSEAAKRNIVLETRYTVEYVEQLAYENHDPENVGASIASGSFRTEGMVVVPCTIKTLSGIANSFSNNLVIRAANVTLKEKRPLILVVRETPLHKGHLKLLWHAANIGATILPPVPAFYHGPKTIQDLIDHTVGKILDCLHIEHGLYQRWDGSNRIGEGN